LSHDANDLVDSLVGRSPAACRFSQDGHFNCSTNTDRAQHLDFVANIIDQNGLIDYIDEWILLSSKRLHSGRTQWITGRNRESRIREAAGAQE
jgi:hypothetical protein